MMRARLLAPAAALASTVVAMASLATGCSSGGERPAGVGASSAGSLSRAFETSAATQGVPRDLMVAIAETEGSLGMPAVREVETNAAVPVAGPMQLRHGHFDSLARGAALTGASELDLRRDTDRALEAGARVLAELGGSTGAAPEDLASWSQAVEEMSGYADDAHRKHYAHRVFSLLARGGTFAGRDGEPIQVAPHDLPPTLTMDLAEGIHALSGSSDYGAAEWVPTSCVNKCTAGRGGNTVEFVVIHDTEGGWDASVSTLQNDPGKSVQYIVGTDGRVAQFIHETDTAWHAGNFYYNERSVGIEHVGYANKPYPEAQYAASAKLVSYLTGKFGVPKTRDHIIGHDQVPNGNAISDASAACAEAPAACEKSSNFGGSSNHRDPGVWEWAGYMDRLGGTAKCNDTLPIWSCSASAARAFRCSNGQVEVETCNGKGACQASVHGQDATCNRGPVIPGHHRDDTRGAVQLGADVPAAGDPSAPRVDSASLTAPTDGASGCSSSGTSAGSSGAAFGLLALLGIATARRRKRSGQRART